MATKAVTEAGLRLAGQFFTDGFQQALASWNHERLSPQFPSDDWQKLLERDFRMLRLEGGFIEELRREVAAEAAEAPTDVEGFIAWFEALKEDGPGQEDPLFPWIAEQADREEISWSWSRKPPVKPASTISSLTRR